MKENITRLARALLFASAFCGLVALAQQTSPNVEASWPTYGGNPGGQRYSAAKEITRANVNSLQPAWTYHTGALDSGSRSVKKSNFEATPILFNNSLYLDTPFDRVIALDPETGEERWTYDPKIPDDIIVSNYTSRGVAAWHPTQSGAGPCAARIFVATLDARLIALDSANGKPCADFGAGGTVDLKAGVPTGKSKYLSFGNTSPPTVIGDVVVVGSAIVDNFMVEVEPGVVRGFDVRSGKQLWSWNPIPWANGQHPRTSAANAWSILSADPVHNLVFVPSGAASPDFFGGLRPGDDRDANSIVALDATTGKKVWAFQLVHHDVWDYDVAAQPLLFDMPDGTPAIAASAKTGMVFVLNRLTGKPLVPIEERAVPQNGVPGEVLSPTQPFSSLPALNALTFDPHQPAAGHDVDDAKYCHDEFARLRYNGIFTPPTLSGTLQYPGSLGGTNWGSMSYDPTTGVLYANTNGSAYEIRLVPHPKEPKFFQEPWLWWSLAGLMVVCGAVLRKRPPAPYVFLALAVGFVVLENYLVPPPYFTYERRHNMVNSPDSIGELSANFGAPYRIFRRSLQDSKGRPCTPMPWGSTTALDLRNRKLLWTKPLGTLIAGQKTGTVNFGAPIVTAGGLLFTAASSEPLLRAIDKSTGEEVWTGKLPVPAQSTPMAYTVNDREYIVVAAGGHGGLGTPLGDSLVAFALPK